MNDLYQEEYKIRRKKLVLLRSVLRQNREEILRTLQLDLGKSFTEGYLSEYYVTMEELDHTIKHLKQWMKPKRVKTPIVHFLSSSKVYYRPYGLVGIVSPWNYPFHLSMIPLIGAIAAGNKIVLKLSAKSKYSTQLITKLVNEVFTEDEVQILGLEENAKEEFNSIKFDFLFFTGSTNVGRSMYQKAALDLTPVVLELGGKSPVIITKQTDIPVAARRVVWGKCMNAGQTCVAPDYCLVDKDIASEFMRELKKGLEEFYGKEPLKNKNLGSIIDQNAFQRFIYLMKEEGIYQEEFIIKDERKILPQFFETTTDSPFMEEEIFGPFLPILCYETLDEALSIIKKYPEPLALYLFTKDLHWEEKVMEEISFGGGCVNDVLTQLGSVYLPFGGVGRSGMGRYHGKQSFLTFSQETSLLTKRYFPDIPLRYPSFQNFKALTKILRK